MTGKEEKELEERLRKLERRYKESLFEEKNNSESLPDLSSKSSSNYADMNFDNEDEMIFGDESKEKNIRGNIGMEKSANKKIMKDELVIEDKGVKKINSLTPPKFVKPFFNKSQEIKNRISVDEIRKCAEDIKKIKKEIRKAVVGQDEIIDGLIMGLLCNSHVLLEGVPGIAKTLAIRALGAVSGCDVKRIQFTVDMLPTDIIGLTIYSPQKGFEVVKGPVFANFIIGDEINRAPPKTQSALIEAMQEKQVTIGKERFPLPEPFFVMATENPIENAGVYPLPEAQIDRFLFKLLMEYPEENEEREIMESNITLKKFEDFNLKPVINQKRILEMQESVKKVYLDDSVKSYILSIVRKTRDVQFGEEKNISYGSSPRASIGLFIASKARALIKGRDYVLPEDVQEFVYPVMRHRLILSYKAVIQKTSPDAIIREILDSVEVE